MTTRAPARKRVRVRKRTPVRVIIRAAARAGFSSYEAIVGLGRTKHLVDIRFAIVTVATAAGRGPVEIGRVLNRDHATIANLRDRARKLVAEGGPRGQRVAALIHEIQARLIGDRETVAAIAKNREAIRRQAVHWRNGVRVQEITRGNHGEISDAGT